MKPEMKLGAVTPTVFLRRRGNGLEQLARVQVRNGTSSAVAGALTVVGPDGLRRSQPAEFAPGESTIELFVPELKTAGTLEFGIASGTEMAASLQVPWAPPRHWTVHVIQQSHHDLGYTSLPSRVLEEHDQWLDQALEIAGDMRRYPDDARFRIVIEQAWSLEHYLGHASPAKTRRMMQLLRSGQFELTALAGNLTTELCGHEILIRALYPTARLQHEYGIPVISAEHNDIPGFVWGLSEILAGAGIRLFCPGLPLYYNWGAKTYPSFWDEAGVFGRRGTPGAFWWETPSGQRLLFWCGNSGCGGDCRGNLPTLADHLRKFEEKGYPWDVTRWVVIGGARDNSPYIPDYCKTIREWNRTWAWPRLVSSTNARFYADFTQRADLSTIPVHRGDMPGQDYPVGAISTAAATAANRRNHADFPAAEALATAAMLHAAHPYPHALLTDIAREIVLHDEHSWGFHFPCGPTPAATELEKAVLALRAAAGAHDVSRKAMARLADAVRLETDDIHLVVFNPLPRERTDYVSAPLRELDNAGSDMVPIPAEKDPQGSGYLQGVILNTRWPVHPPPEIAEGRFDLIDVVTGEAVPYQIEELDSAIGPESYAAQRLGLGAGGKRLGVMDRPVGLARTLCFRAGPVLGLGYRTYRLRPRPDRPTFAAGVTAAGMVLGNRFWRLELDPATGALRSLRDLATGREWVDTTAPHPFGVVLIREPNGSECLATCCGVTVTREGPLSASLRATFAAPGHPRIESTVTLRADDCRIEFAVCMLKAPDAFLDAYVAFPSALPGGEFTCDTPLCVYDPARDRLPGAYANRITVQNWLRIASPTGAVRWSSLDAPVVSLGRFWPPRVSQAHSCVVPDSLTDPPQPVEALRGGTVYSQLTGNNFGTNFSVSQTGLLQFRYAFTAGDDAQTTEACAEFGAAATTPFQTMFTRQHGRAAAPPAAQAAQRRVRPAALARFPGQLPPSLPPVGGALTVEHPAVQLLAFKLAEAESDLILRLWNVSERAAATRVRLPGVVLKTARLNMLTETDTGPDLPVDQDSFTVSIPARQVLTVRLQTARDVKAQ